MDMKMENKKIDRIQPCVVTPGQQSWRDGNQWETILAQR
jgi:hypothetical protein